MNTNRVLQGAIVALGLLTGTVWAQTCNPNIPASTPDSQLVDNGNGTITDLKTGLMWKQCPEGRSGADCDLTMERRDFRWEEVFDYVAGSEGFAGYGDWRVPNVKELASLVEFQCSGPSINTHRFPNPQDGDSDFYSRATFITSSLAFDGIRGWNVRFYADNPDRKSVV